MARSRSLTGPYELHPDTYILTARDRPDLALQRAGHADLVDTPTGRDLHRVPLRAADSQSRPLHAGPRDRDPADDVGSRRLAPDHGWAGPADAGGRGARPAGAHVLAGAGTRGLRRPEAADRSFSGCARPGPTSCSACPRGPGICGCTAARRWAACSASPWSRGASSRTASAPAPWWTSSRSISSRWPASSATTTARSSTTSTSRTTTRSGRHIRVMSALPDHVQADAFTAPVADSGRHARASPRGSGFRASPLRLPRGRRRVDVAAAVLRCQHPVGRSHRARDCRTSRARLSAWHVRTWRAPADRQISTTSSTGSAAIRPTLSVNRATEGQPR